jgi:hypothetical protein
MAMVTIIASIIAIMEQISTVIITIKALNFKVIIDTTIVTTITSIKQHSCSIIDSIFIKLLITPFYFIIHTHHLQHHPHNSNPLLLLHHHKYLNLNHSFKHCFEYITIHSYSLIFPLVIILIVAIILIEAIVEAIALIIKLITSAIILIIYYQRYIFTVKHFIIIKQYLHYYFKGLHLS